MSTVLSFAPKQPKSTWARKHLAFVDEATVLLTSHLSMLTDQQFALEHAELRALLSSGYAIEMLGSHFVADEYRKEAVRREQIVKNAVRDVANEGAGTPPSEVPA